MQNPYSARIKGVQMKKYKIIYADPPWRYARSKVQGAAEKHYPTMSIEELCALPVKEIADKDCILFLWATFPQLKEALQLIKAWGFTYKSVAFVWLKQNRKSPTWFYGLGFWTRGNAEICLLATKGHPKRQSNKVHQFIISPVEQHSKKPDITREKILDIHNRLVCFDIKELGTQLRKLGMLIVQDQVWNRVTINRSEGKATRYYIDEFHWTRRSAC